AAATQLLAHTLGLTGTAAALTTTAGEQLKVFVEGGALFLQGAAELTFKGELYLEAMGLK
ncbi:MAG: diaminopimelate epimerase, partial [Pseudodesulfovibrio sp.]|nr:diaminopimelate epimerase [Pseudodesulfovibrio sp.]